MSPKRLATRKKKFTFLLTEPNPSPLCIKTDILTTLTYFDIFSYPLTQTEIFFFLPNQHSLHDVNWAIDHLLREQLIYQFDEMYSLHDNYELIARRRKGNLAAKKLLAKGEKIAGFLSAFPFVRGVAISGSLSKNFADENSDIDFFIITVKNRLWIARTFMHMFKKLAILIRKDHFFCMNYFVDETGMEIKEKNVYTATELATLMPLRGITVFQDLFRKNSWSRDWLPNQNMRVSHAKEASNNGFKKIIEWIFNNRLGSWIEQTLMNITAKRWRKKKAAQKLNNNGYVMGLDAGRHYAKPDPHSFQKKMMDVYDQRIEAVLYKYEHRLKPVH